MLMRGAGDSSSCHLLCDALLLLLLCGLPSSLCSLLLCCLPPPAVGDTHHIILPKNARSKSQVLTLLCRYYLPTYNSRGLLYSSSTAAAE